MSDLDRDQRVAAAVQALEKEEAHKRMLYDRTIGGPMVPRPSEDFIRQNVGDLKSPAQIQKEAEANVDKQMRQERAEAREREALEKSAQRRGAGVEQDDNGPRARDRSMSRDDDQSRKRNLGTDRKGTDLGR